MGSLTRVTPFLSEGETYDSCVGMPDAKDSRNLVPAARAAVGTLGAPLRKGRLSVMPLAVLLPTLGDLKNVPLIRPQITRHLEELHAEASTLAGEEEGEERRKRQAEESMLNQVLLWLSVGGED